MENSELLITLGQLTLLHLHGWETMWFVVPWNAVLLPLSYWIAFG